MQQNAGAYVPKQAMRPEVVAEIRAMFNAPDRKVAELLLQEAIWKYTLSAPRLSARIEENLTEEFTVFDFPPEHHSARSAQPTVWKGLIRRFAGVQEW